MARLRARFALFFAFLSLLACRKKPAEVPQTATARGRVVYDKYCALCHGENGEGYRADEATQLRNEEFLAIASDTYLAASIRVGRTGRTMSAWSKERGGPLEESDIADVVALIRSWGKRSYAQARAPGGRGDPRRAQPIYDAQCSGCHGANGREGRYVELGNPAFLEIADNGFLAASIEHGRPGTPMTAFPLGTERVSDLVALLREWQKPARETPPLPPLPGKLKNVVLNSKGQAPAFSPKADFTPLATVREALEAKRRMVIADARPPADYALGHIAGSISVPFYDAAKYAGDIPKDAFVITYCGCPHAESGQARDALRKLGYKSSVLDEGFLAWKKQGYAVNVGAEP